MRSVSFEVFGVAQSKGSARAFIRNGRAIVTTDNPSLKSWESVVRFAAQRVIANDPRLFDGALKLSVTFHLPRPASVSVKKRPFPITRPDLDKACRGCLDPLSGVLFHDDAQVVAIEATKIYTAGPAKAVITISEVVPGAATHA